MDVNEHYAMMLGTHSPWEIASVDLKLAEQQADIAIEYADLDGTCPECGANCPRYDLRQSRTWRHLDTLQFATDLHCSSRGLIWSNDLGHLELS